MPMQEMHGQVPNRKIDNKLEQPHEINNHNTKNNTAQKIDNKHMLLVMNSETIINKTIKTLPDMARRNDIEMIIQTDDDMWNTLTIPIKKYSDYDTLKEKLAASFRERRVPKYLMNLLVLPEPMWNIFLDDTDTTHEQHQDKDILIDDTDTQVTEPTTTKNNECESQ
ncbi:3021_t:CDS:2 [Gigaspora margarita]|uniref:3021_t:CDS:1 n=1 Tax=Gigaspora margarita TaxID=4874 RepID=A0ABN7UID9_GIGMA|nr:3021_t:CDS:2 [Gigaspora margarita]